MMHNRKLFFIHYYLVWKHEKKKKSIIPKTLANRRKGDPSFSKGMSWVPPDLATLCQPHSTVSTCQPPAFMFLALVAHLFGYSQDPFHRDPSRDFDSFPWKFDECVISNARHSSPIKDAAHGRKNVEGDEGLSREENESDESETVKLRPSIVNFEEICNSYPRRTEIVSGPLPRIYDALRIDQGERLGPFLNIFLECRIEERKNYLLFNFFFL